MDRRRFLRILGASAALAGLGAPLASCSRSGGTSWKKKVVVLGLDGLDPNIVRALIDSGRMPNFKKLAEMGSFMKLGTTMPALSPVAWSSFITGLTPGGHGIADFIMRDPETYSPVFSIWKNTEPSTVVNIGGLTFPVKGGGPRNLRLGKPFWAYLTEQGIPAIVVKAPTDFPVDDSATRAISGMGTPDLTDAYGTFSYYTTDPFEEYPNLSGGEVFYIDLSDDTARAELPGPGHPFDESAGRLEIPFTIHRDPVRDIVRIDIQGDSIMLQPREFSRWVKVNFDIVRHVNSLSGIVRFMVKEVHPHLRLYVTPINIDPEDQPVPVTSPESYGAEIAREIGSFWTKGLPADTKAFDYGVFDDEDYVNESSLILEERMKLFDYEWSRFKSGLFFFYVSNTDQDAHMLWRNMDESHPMHGASDLRFSGYLADLYQRMDGLVGKVLPAIDDDTLLLICSDHGFAQFGRQFHLNTWLREQGYLNLKAGAERKEHTSHLDIDWSRTLAYGMGFNGLYLNLRGREASGIVQPGQVADLSNRLTRELRAVVDPETGKRPVAQVYRRDAMYIGEATPEMPELFVGYAPGFRSSADSVLAETGRAVIDVNPWPWSGDHSMARDAVPGTLISSVPIRKTNPGILDLPVSILRFFGIEKPAQMVGSSIF
jgi:predicted AlkP superfamily phosphohydrolase/phosphomutase